MPRMFGDVHHVLGRYWYRSIWIQCCLFDLFPRFCGLLIDCCDRRFWEERYWYREASLRRPCLRLMLSDSQDEIMSRKLMSCFGELVLLCQLGILASEMSAFLMKKSLLTTSPVHSLAPAASGSRLVARDVPTFSLHLPPSECVRDCRDSAHVLHRWCIPGFQRLDMRI